MKISKWVTMFLITAASVQVQAYNSEVTKKDRLHVAGPSQSQIWLTECSYGHLRNEKNIYPDQTWTPEMEDAFVNKCLTGKLRSASMSPVDGFINMSPESLSAAMIRCRAEADGLTGEERARKLEFCLGRIEKRGSLEAKPDVIQSAEADIGIGESDR